MASEGVPAELVDEIKRVIAASFSAPADDYTEIVEETANPEVYEDVDRDTYIEAMEEVFNEYDVPQPMREQVYEQLDAQGGVGANQRPKGLSVHTQYLRGRERLQATQRTLFFEQCRKSGDVPGLELSRALLV